MQINCEYTELVDINTLVPHEKNCNKHPDEQVRILAKLINYQGWRLPIIVSTLSKKIVAGHGRWEAAKSLGYEKVPVSYQDFESKEQEIAFLISDNKIGILAKHDDSMMIDEIKELGIDDFELLGLDDFELPLEVDPAKEEIEDDVPTDVETRCKPGDLWILGEHRLLCGDSTNIQHVERLMGGEKADLIHTDPPYNVDYSNQDRPKAGKKDLGRISNDKMSDEKFLQFLTDCFSVSYAFCNDNSSIYIWYASKETINFHTAAAAAAGWDINQQIIWKKPMLLGRGRYQWAHEPCVFGVKGKPFFTKDRTKTTVWDFGGYDKSKNVHPTQKPVFIPEEAINNSSKIGSNVLDLFGGSGSTLIACEKTGRKCYMMELDPHYCSVIIARWEKYSGKEATLAD